MEKKLLLNMWIFLFVLILCVKLNLISSLGIFIMNNVFSQIFSRFEYNATSDLVKEVQFEEVEGLCYHNTRVAYGLCWLYAP